MVGAAVVVVVGALVVVVVVGALVVVVVVGALVVVVVVGAAVVVVVVGALVVVVVVGAAVVVVVGATVVVVACGLVVAATGVAPITVVGDKIDEGTDPGFGSDRRDARLAMVTECAGTVEPTVEGRVVVVGTPSAAVEE